MGYNEKSAAFLKNKTDEEVAYHFWKALQDLFFHADYWIKQNQLVAFLYNKTVKYKFKEIFDNSPEYEYFFALPLDYKHPETGHNCSIVEFRSLEFSTSRKFYSSLNFECTINIYDIKPYYLFQNTYNDVQFANFHAEDEIVDKIFIRMIQKMSKSQKTKLFKGIICMQEKPNATNVRRLWRFINKIWHIEIPCEIKSKKYQAWKPNTPAGFSFARVEHPYFRTVAKHEKEGEKLQLGMILKSEETLIIQDIIREFKRGKYNMKYYEIHGLTLQNIKDHTDLAAAELTNMQDLLK